MITTEDARQIAITRFKHFNEAKGVQFIASAPPPKPSQQSPSATKADAGELERLAVELRSFVTRFGAENGTKWFNEGKTWKQALDLHEQLTAKPAFGQSGWRP